MNTRSLLANRTLVGLACAASCLQHRASWSFTMRTVLTLTVTMCWINSTMYEVSRCSASSWADRGAELAVMRLGDFCRRRDATSSRSSTAPPSFLAPSSPGYINKETRLGHLADPCTGARSWPIDAAACGVTAPPPRVARASSHDQRRRAPRPVRVLRPSPRVRPALRARGGRRLLVRPRCAR